MSEVTSQAVSAVDEIIANSPFKDEIKVTRNGVVLPLQVFVGKRGAWENKPYAAVQITTDDTKEFHDDLDFQYAIKFIGKSNIKNFLNTILKRVGQDYTEDSVNAEGIFSMDAFLKAWENLAATGLKLAELRELLDTEQKKLEQYVSVDLMKIIEAGDIDEIQKAKVAVKERTKSINALRFELEQRAARRSKEAATETVSPE